MVAGAHLGRVSLGCFSSSGQGLSCFEKQESPCCIMLPCCTTITSHWKIEVGEGDEGCPVVYSPAEEDEPGGTAEFF